ncbi:MAG: cytochrome c, partial [Chloroflexi bacterium]|nr:cytochrome c [Chloroflexota bacterium]
AGATPGPGDGGRSLGRVALSCGAAPGGRGGTGLGAGGRRLGGAAGQGDPTKGQAAFTRAGCGACHGDRAQGNVFPGAPKLASTALTCEQVQAQVRTPRDPSKGMPPFSASQISDQEIQDLCAWVKTLP